MPVAMTGNVERAEKQRPFPFVVPTPPTRKLLDLQGKEPEITLAIH